MSWRGDYATSDAVPATQGGQYRAAGSERTRSRDRRRPPTRRRREESRKGRRAGDATPASRSSASCPRGHRRHHHARAVGGPGRAAPDGSRRGVPAGPDRTRLRSARPRPLRSAAPLPDARCPSPRTAGRGLAGTGSPPASTGCTPRCPGPGFDSDLRAPPRPRGAGRSAGAGEIEPIPEPSRNVSAAGSADGPGSPLRRAPSPTPDRTEA